MTAKKRTNESIAVPTYYSIGFNVVHEWIVVFRARACVQINKHSI